MKVWPGCCADKNTAHKDSTVQGEDARVITMFSCFGHPGVAFSKEGQIGFCGRAA